MAGSLTCSNHHRPPQPTKDHARPDTGKLISWVVKRMSRRKLLSASPVETTPKGSQQTVKRQAVVPAQSQPPNRKPYMSGSTNLFNVRSGGNGNGNQELNKNSKLLSSKTLVSYGDLSAEGAPLIFKCLSSASNLGYCSINTFDMCSAICSGECWSRGQPLSTSNENVEDRDTSAKGRLPEFSEGATRTENLASGIADTTGAVTKSHLRCSYEHLSFSV